MHTNSILVIFIACLFTVISPYVHAQKALRELDPIELSIEEIGVAQGLSQGMVHGLQVDLKGYLWIGTKDGLNRYDGNNFHVFRHDPVDTNSIASNYIRSLHIDDRGLVWVGTNNSGLDLYDPVNAKFIHFGTALNSSSSSSTFHCVTQIFSDPSGKILIWDGTGEKCEILIPVVGADPFSIDGWQIKSFDEVYHREEGIPFPSSYMMGFGEDGALLYQAGNILYRNYSDHITTWPPDAIERSKKNVINNNQVVQASYYLDHKRRIYQIKPEEKVLYTWSENENTFKATLQLPADYQFETIGIFIDHKDRIWANSDQAFLRIDPQEGTFQQIKITRYHFAGTDPTDFFIYGEDHHHNLWAGTSGNGIIKFTSRNDQFIQISEKAEQNFGIQLSQDGFSYRIHNKITIAHEYELRKRIEALGLVIIGPFAEDPDGDLWVICGDKKLQYFLVHINPEDLSFSYQPFDFCRPVPSEAVATLMFDRTGSLWIGAECINNQAQLVKLDYPDQSHDTYTFPVEVFHSEHPFITDWYVDDQNVFWLGTKQGLFAFNPGTLQWKQWHIDPDDSHALSNNYILSICPDPTSPKEYLWIGTDGGGLNKMDINAETFQHFSIDDGLPNNVIYAVQSDKHNNLWLSSNLGISRFDPITGKVWSFTMDDGLKSNEYNRFEYGKTKDGRLYFGGIEGLTIFDPEAFYQTSSPSPIVINRLKLSNKEIFFSAITEKDSKEQYHLPAPVENCTKLTIPYTERMITLGFSLLDLTNPNGNKYRYKLEGFNEDWIDAGAENEAVFTNLSPGNYSFLVSGRNSNNVWSSTAQLQLTILSPWWGTWWFRSVVVILIIAGIYGVYRYRLQQAMKLQHLRNRIAADLHDEIGSTLSSISLAGTVIQHKLKDHYPEVDGLVQKINHNTQSMMEAMSDIVWAVNTKNDRFDQVLHRMRAFAAEILEPNEVTVHFDVGPNVSQLHLDMQQRKNLYLIFKEVINNTAKYAQSNNVWISISYVHGKMIMEIRDDGIGFNAQHIHQSELTAGRHPSIIGMGGNGIQNMMQRASELKGKLDIHSSPGKGTIVKLIYAV